MLRKIIALLLSAAMLLSLVGCNMANRSDKDLKIVTTIFPLYDFARAIVKDSAEINLLIDPGSEVHSYEPRPSDIVDIANADLFLMIGGESEEWAKTLVAENRSTLCLIDEFSDSTVHHHKGHSHADEHIWTSPENAIIMVEKICAEICELDSENSEFYRQNAKDYILKIESAAASLQKAIGKNRYILVADRFPFFYLADEYGIEYDAAFDGCAVSTDISLKTMSRLISKIKEKDCKKIYYIEMSNKNIANALCEQTGVALCELHSAHNVTLDDFNAGISYVDILKRNSEALCDEDT